MNLPIADEERTCRSQAYNLLLRDNRTRDRPLE